MRFHNLLFCGFLSITCLSCVDIKIINVHANGSAHISQYFGNAKVRPEVDWAFHGQYFAIPEFEKFSSPVIKYFSGVDSLPFVHCKITKLDSAGGYLFDIDESFLSFEFFGDTLLRITSNEVEPVRENAPTYSRYISLNFQQRIKAVMGDKRSYLYNKELNSVSFPLNSKAIVRKGRKIELSIFLEKPEL